MNRTKRQQAYIDSFENGSEELRFVSFGPCPGCESCMDAHGYHAADFEPEIAEDFPRSATDLWLERQESTLPIELAFSDIRGIQRPAAEIAANIVAEVLGAVRSERAFDEAHSDGEIDDEGSFSWSGCGICGSTLGGTLYDWHWVDSDDEIRHESDGCPDCLFYLSNGDLPEDEHLGWTGEPENEEIEP